MRQIMQMPYIVRTTDFKTNDFTILIKIRHMIAEFSE